MARPTRPGLDYLTVDVEFEDNVKLVIAKHKNEGLGVLLRLWQKCYGVHGYYVEWGEKNAYLFADAINIPVETLNSIVETCFSEDIFHIGMWKKHGILTSAGIQKRWLTVVTERKRKDCTIDPKFDVLLFIPEETTVSGGIIPEETPVSTPGNANKERKVKESKGKKSKGATSAPDVEKIPGDVWKIVVDTWFVFYKTQKGEEPSFEGRDPAHLKAIIRLVEKKVLAAPGHRWDAETCAAHFTRFLQIAYLDPWLKQNFLLQNLLNQFDKIIANGRPATTLQSTGPNGSAVPATNGTSSARTAALKNWGTNVSTGHPPAATG